MKRHLHIWIEQDEREASYPLVAAMLREHADEIMRRGETNLDATGEHIIEGHGRITWEMELP